MKMALAGHLKWDAAKTTITLRHFINLGGGKTVCGGGNIVYIIVYPTISARDHCTIVKIDNQFIGNFDNIRKL